MLLKLRLFLALLIFTIGVFGQNMPTAKKGTLDARLWDFTQKGVLKLDGEWEFYWKKLLTPTQIESGDHEPSYIDVPKLFHQVQIADEDIGSFGYATFRLRILNSEKTYELAIRHKRIFSASRVWINGILVGEHGTVATSRNQEKALLFANMYPFSGKDTLEMVIQISNYNHKKGGIPTSIIMGKASDLTEARAQGIGLDSFLFGILIVISFYHLGIFFARKRDMAAFHFAIFGLSIAMYLSANNEIIITHIWPGIPWWLYQKLNYTGTLVRLYFWAAFLVALFPQDGSRKVVKWIGWPTLFLELIILFTPSYFFTFALPPIIVLSVAGLLYIVYMTFRTLIKRREGAIYTFIGTMAMFLTGINDVLHEMMIIQTSFLLPFGVFIFFLMQSFMLAMHFAKSFNRTEELSIELRLLNENLEEIVQRRTMEIEQQKEEILAQRDEIERQRDYTTEQNEILVKQNQEIHDSILYARSIQQALLPPRDVLENAFPDHFVLFTPRDIVSGDFYWFKELHRNGSPVYVAAAADCTGHGVPGAFLSMLGMSLLNEIVPNREFTTASHILEEMRDELKAALRQSDGFRQRKDGIDIALCIVEPAKNRLQFSGAYNPMFLIRDGELQEIKGVPSPIGIHRNEQAFKNHEIELLTGDTIYIFSDGYVDQLGGNQNFKFLKKNFKELLLEIHEKPMEEQKVILEYTMDQWRDGRQQIDDILVFGIKINQ